MITRLHCQDKNDKISILRIFHTTFNVALYDCFVSAKFGPLMIFLKRWFAYNETMRGEMHEYQEKVII
jgi:hypothetical protein